MCCSKEYFSRLNDSFPQPCLFLGSFFRLNDCFSRLNIVRDTYRDKGLGEPTNDRTDNGKFDSLIQKWQIPNGVCASGDG